MNTSKSPFGRQYFCGNCPNYHDMGDRGAIGPDVKDIYRFGNCRKNPPSSYGYPKWPDVSFFDYCGAHPSAPQSRQEQLLERIASRLDSSSGADQQTPRMAFGRSF